MVRVETSRSKVSLTQLVKLVRRLLPRGYLEGEEMAGKLLLFFDMVVADRDQWLLGTFSFPFMFIVLYALHQISLFDLIPTSR